MVFFQSSRVFSPGVWRCSAAAVMPESSFWVDGVDARGGGGIRETGSLTRARVSDTAVEHPLTATRSPGDRVPLDERAVLRVNFHSPTAATAVAASGHCTPRQPLTAPEVMPATICRLKNRYMISGGIVISRMSMNSRV